jgi:hypothetical protein
MGAGAVYLYKLTNGTWSQVQKIAASDSAANDRFGSSVALCNNLLVVGAPAEDEDAAGGNSQTDAGSAYVFQNDAGTWSQQQKLVASDRSAGAGFGSAVSLSLNRLVVTAPDEDSGTGSAYVFVQNSGSWTQEQKLTASDKQAGDRFGNSVSLSDKTLLIGAADEDEDASGNNTLASSGAAYLYQYASGSWSAVQKLVASDRAADDRFGCSVSLSGDYAVVGASNEDEDAAGANTLSDAGSTYLFKNNAGTWSQYQKLVTSDRAAGDHFGGAVSLSGGLLLVGAANEDEDARLFNTLSSAGSAYFFKNTAGTWTQNQKIAGADRSANDQFAYAVGFAGKNGIVGIPGDSHNASGSDSLATAGSAVFFKFEPAKRTWNGSSWGTAPTASDSAVINGTYNAAGFSCLDLVVNAGKKISLTSKLSVFGNLTLKSDATSGKATLVDNGNTVFAANGVNVEQYLTGAGGASPTGRFWYISSPVADASNRIFDLGNSNPLNKFWSHSEATASYTQQTDRLALAPGQGYVARLGANKTVVFTGSELNTGDLSIPITYTGSTNMKRGYNLVGNPYPSFVELDLLDNPGIEQTIWYRSLTASGTAMAFDTYNLASNTSVVASGSGSLTAYIPPQQAFWIKVLAEGTTNLVFRNAKRSQQTGVALRSSEGESVRLQLSNCTLSDETLIGFYIDADAAFDRFDSHKFSNDNPLLPELFTFAGVEEVAINGLPVTDSLTELKLGFRTGGKGMHTLSATSVSPDLNVWLEDKLTNSTIPLADGQSYAFQPDAQASNERFSLLVGKTATRLADVGPGFDVLVSDDKRLQLRGTDANAVGVRVVDAWGNVKPYVGQALEPGIYLVQWNGATGFQQKKVRIAR